MNLCENAIEKLRNAGRTYYLIELLEIKLEISEAMPDGTVPENLEEKELLSVIKNLYTEYNIPAYMQDCTYLYQQKWIFAMSDVLRIRREMFGLTQEQLCEGL